MNRRFVSSQYITITGQSFQLNTNKGTHSFSFKRIRIKYWKPLSGPIHKIVLVVDDATKLTIKGYEDMDDMLDVLKQQVSS